MTQALDQLLQAAAKGDAHAWRSLVEAYSGRVYGLLYRQCGSADLAEEITQATFVKVVTELPAYEEQGRFEAWLFRIAINRLRDELRRRKRQAIAVDFETTPPEALGGVATGPGPSDAMHRREQIKRLRAAIDRLPDADRELLHLRYTAELSFAEIAETLDQPLGTVLARGHRALKKLRDMLDDREK
jgi:RNA polymerase sigma-70 factor (ECF subfamily)